MGSMKSASAPPRGGAREPGSYDGCSIWIVSIDYQSKRRDVCTAVQRLRSDVVVVVRKIFYWGVSPSKKFEHSYCVPNIHIWTFESTSIIPLAYPLLSMNTTHTAQHLYIYVCNPRPERSRGP